MLTFTPHFYKEFRMEQFAIYADTQEVRSGIPELLEERGVKVTVQKLDLGDYLLSHRVCVERKTSRDFVQSIKTKRLFKQALQLKESYEKPLLLIEGYNLYNLAGVHPAGIRGALAMIAVSVGLPVIFSKDVDDTVKFLLTIIKQERALKQEVSYYPKRKAISPSQEIERIMESFPGIGPVLSEHLLTHYRTLEEVLSAPTSELTKIPMIGKKKASMIKEILRREYRAGEGSRPRR